MSTKYVVLTGAESSGKTTLAQSLAKHFKVPLVKEYARAYLQDKVSYLPKDLILMAKEQHRLITNELAHTVICDTDLLTIKIWSEFKYGESIEWVDEHLTQFHSKQEVLYLLCSPNIPWEKDPLRENPNNRMAIHLAYKNYLELNRCRFLEIEGSRKERQFKGVSALLSFFK